MRTIEFACPGCSTPYVVPENRGGKPTTCKVCAYRIRVPAETIKFFCLGCQHRYTVPARKAGKSTACAKCGLTVTVPFRDEQTPTSMPSQTRALPEPPPIEIPAEPLSSTTPTLPDFVIAPSPVTPVAPLRRIERRVEVPAWTPGPFETVRPSERVWGCAASWAVIAASGALAVFLICGGGWSMLGLGGRDEGSFVNPATIARERPNDRHAAPSPRALALSESQTIEGLTVDITSVAIGQYDLETIHGDVKSKDEAFLVRLTLSTADPTIKYDHRSWSDVYTMRPTVVLKDDIGNLYKTISLGFGNRLAGIEPTHCVTDGKPARDAIPFQIPVKGARELELTLECPDRPMKEKFRFRIPKSLWATPGP